MHHPFPSPRARTIIHSNTITLLQLIAMVCTHKLYTRGASIWNYGEIHDDTNNHENETEKHAHTRTHWVSVRQHIWTWALVCAFRFKWIYLICHRANTHIYTLSFFLSCRSISLLENPENRCKNCENIVQTF